MRSELHMVLLPNRRCVRAVDSSVSGTLRDEMGNWAGSVGSGGSGSEDRGIWTAGGDLLELSMDDGSVYEYRCTIEGSSMLTVNTSGGAQRYWERAEI